MSRRPSQSTSRRVTVSPKGPKTLVYKREAFASLPKHIEEAIAVREELEPMVAHIQEALDDHPGRKAVVQVAGLLASMYLGQCRPKTDMYLSVTECILMPLSSDELFRLGVAPPGGRPPTYRQLSKLHRRLRDHCASQADESELAMNKQRHGAHAAAVIGGHMIQILEKKLGTDIDLGFDIAIDSLDVPTHAVTPFTGDADCKDPASVRGHAPAKNDRKSSTALIDELHLSVATRIGATIDVPRTIRSLCLDEPNTRRVAAALHLIDDMNDRGDPVKTVIFDRGYSAAHHERLAIPLLDRGIDKLIDQPPDGKKHKIVYHQGVMVVDGTPLCPNTPKGLVDLPFVPKSRPKEERVKINASYNERERYAFTVRQANTPSGGSRMECPAQAGKVKCPYVDASVRGKASKPTVQPEGPRPKCCSQKKITVSPLIDAKNRQKEHYGTSAWDKAYNQRNRVESANAAMRREFGEIEHGSIKTFNRPLATLWFAVRAMAVNRRAHDLYEQRHEHDDPIAARTNPTRAGPATKLICAPQRGSVDNSTGPRPVFEPD